MSKLEELEVILFQGEDDELKLLKYFLENGKVLKELLIYSCHLTFEEKWNFFEKVVKFQRASKTCRITYTDKNVCC